MPRVKFKPVNATNLARVFVAILAMDPDDIAMIIETFVADKTATIAIREHFTNNREQFSVPTANDLAKLFDAILSTPKEVREVFVVEFDRVLNEIHESDGFGTGGRCDPRGSHRS